MENIDVKQELENILSRIRDVRKERGRSLESVCAGIGLSESVYRKIEDNETKLSLERFLKIAKELGVSAKELMVSSISKCEKVNDDDVLLKDGNNF